MRIAIGGSVNFRYPAILDRWCWEVKMKHGSFTLNTGCTNGAWKLAEIWASQNGIKITQYPFPGNFYKNSMDLAANSDGAIIFQDNCPFTEKVIDVLKFWDVPTKVIQFEKMVPITFRCLCGFEQDTLQTRWNQEFCPVCGEIDYRIYDSRGICVM